MKNKLKILYILLLGLFIIPMRVSASITPIKSAMYQGYDYVINSYDVGFNQKIILMFLVPLLGLIISILLWYRYGKDEKVTETLEFYPPEGLNSLEASSLYNGKAKKKDVTSLLIYLANKGYIKFIETDKSFLLSKVKEYDGNNVNEYMFLKGLFSEKDAVNLSKARAVRKYAKTRDSKINYVDSLEMAVERKKFETVDTDILWNNFYITMRDIVRNINKKENKEKVFAKSFLVNFIILILLILLSLATIITIPVLAYGTVDDVVKIFTILIFCVLSLLFINNLDRRVGIKVFWNAMIIISLLISLSEITAISIFIAKPLYLLGTIFGIGCIIGMIICLKFMPRRTLYGNEMLGKIKGFKSFLKTAEKDKLEALVMQNPNYFYDILPYAYALGVFDEWIKKFEAIAVQSPSWYDSPKPFSVATFRVFMNRTMVSAQKAMTYNPPINSGHMGI